MWLYTTHYIYILWFIKTYRKTHLVNITGNYPRLKFHTFYIPYNIFCFRVVIFDFSDVSQAGTKFYARWKKGSSYLNLKFQPQRRSNKKKTYMHDSSNKRFVWGSKSLNGAQISIAQFSTQCLPFRRQRC